MIILKEANNNVGLIKKETFNYLRGFISQRRMIQAEGTVSKIALRLKCALYV